jgi:hypothetical protein
MSRDLLNLTNSEEEKNILLIEAEINRYFKSLEGTNDSFDVSNSILVEIPFKNLTNLSNELKDIFKIFLKNFEERLTDTYGISMVGSKSRSTKDHMSINFIYIQVISTKSLIYIYKT